MLLFVRPPVKKLITTKRILLSLLVLFLVLLIHGPISGKWVSPTDFCLCGSHNYREFKNGTIGIKHTGHPEEDILNFANYERKHLFFIRVFGTETKKSHWYYPTLFFIFSKNDGENHLFRIIFAWRSFK